MHPSLAKRVKPPPLCWLCGLGTTAEPLKPFFFFCQHCWISSLTRDGKMARAFLTTGPSGKSHIQLLYALSSTVASASSVLPAPGTLALTSKAAFFHLTCFASSSDPCSSFTFSIKPALCPPRLRVYFCFPPFHGPYACHTA